VVSGKQNCHVATQNEFDNIKVNEQKYASPIYSSSLSMSLLYFELKNRELLPHGKGLTLRFKYGYGGG